jgi:EmrB/QacA subfamily drug resistance transporter
MNKNRWLILGLLALAQFMVVLDVSIVNVALPAIQKALHFAPADLQWIVTAYTLAVGGFLLLGGRVADLYGRKKTFLIGVIGFGIASLIVGSSESSSLMIAARGIQGFAAAFMSPAALSILLITFNEGKERNQALGVWSAVAAGGAAFGVLLGGLLTQYLNWRWNFYINVPVSIFVAIAAWRILPLHESESEHKELDIPGAILVTGGLVSLVYGLTKAPSLGWTSHTTILTLGLAVVLLASFIFNESRAKNPLVPLSIFRIRNLTAANLVQLPVTASLYSMFFFLSLYIQVVLRYSPSLSGLSFLPVTIIIGITATISSSLVTKIGFKRLMVIAPLFMAAGLFMLSHIRVNGSYFADVFPGLAVMAVGLGMTFVSITIAATSGVSSDKSGLASGILNTAQQIGGALGLAILSGVASSAVVRSLTAAGSHSALALVTAQVDGYQAAFRVGIGFAITASVLAFILIKENRSEVVSAPIVSAH